MKKYILTGGASSGKSSIITALELRGEHVINESAESVARYNNAMGLKNQHGTPQFQQDTLKLFLQREDRVLKLNPKRVFYDRGIHDILDYSIKYGASGFLNELINRSTNHEYLKVFSIDRLSNFDKTEYRKEESAEETNKMGEQHIKTYENFGLKVICVPDIGLEKRVDFVLKHCEDRKHEDDFRTIL